VPAGLAQAARRPYLYGYDTSSIPAGDVEIETWFDYMNKPKVAADEVRWWIGARWAPVEGLELALLTIVAQDLSPSQAGGNSAQLWGELLELRWRALRFESVGDFSLQLDLRMALANDQPHQVSPSIGWAHKWGRLGASAQVGYAAGFAGSAENDHYHWLVWRGGMAVDVVRGQISPLLQLGVEGFGEATLSGFNDLVNVKGSTANVGPTLSVAKGRAWVTAGVLFGLTQTSPTALARLILGLAF
jgi:hypothetical protein